MSISPPRSPSIGRVWVDPFTAERFIFIGEETREPDEALNGWVLWQLANEQYEYGQGEES